MDGTFSDSFVKVKALCEKEFAEQKVAVNIEDIPISYELISNEWLSNIICKGFDGAEVVNHWLDKADDGTSNRRRIFLEYNGEGINAGLPSSVFCKATQSLENRYVLGVSKSGQGEFYFYNNVRPLLDIEAPEPIFSNINFESLNSITIMKDLGSAVEFCDYDADINFKRAKSQVCLMAKYHAAFYKDSKLQEHLKFFSTINEFNKIVEDELHYSEARVRGFLAAKEVIPARLYKQVKEVEAATLLAYEQHLHLPSTLLHNDTHLRNWYIAANGEMGLADWQIMASGHGTRDLAFAVSTSLTIENRRAWEKELIKCYLEKLADEGASHLSFEDTYMHYKQQLLCALGNWTFTLTPPPGSPEMQPEKTSLEFIKRMTYAIDDLDVLATFDEISTAGI